MELRQLEYFVAVAEEANFTRAAAKVHVAQPGVSAQIRRLEREFGQPLLDRSGRTVRLTEVGSAVMPYVRAALAAVDGAKNVVGELTGLVRGRVTVGMLTLCAALDIPSLLADFYRQHPDIEIKLVEANSDVLVDAMQRGEIDMAFVGISGESPAGIETQTVADDEVVAAVGVEDDLADRKSIQLSDLFGRRLICLPSGTGTRSAFDRACASISMKAGISFEASDPRVLAKLASWGFGVAILPESIPRISEYELRTLSIQGPSLRSRVDLAWRANGPLSPAAQALVGYSRAVVDAITIGR